MRKSNFSRALAVFLALVMCFTMTTTISFADHNSSTPETKNVVVFGASTSSGYGLADFYNDNAGFAVQNNDLTNWSVEDAKRADRGRLSELSYPWQLKQYIQDTEGVSVDLSAMCLNGMRSNELRALLDEDYYEAVYEWEKSTTAPSYNPNGADPNEDIGFLTNHIRSFTRHLGWGGAEVDGQPVSNSSDPDGDGIASGNWPDWSVGMPGTANYKLASAYTKKEIENADVIVVDVCMNNFGTYLAERIAGKHNVPSKEYAENYWKQEKEDIVGVSPTTLSLADKMKKTLTLMIGALSDSTAQEFLDAFIYCYADCITNFSADIELINQYKKPDAKIIAVGVYNTLDGINLVLANGQVIDFGDVAAKGFDLVNAYIKGLDKNSNNYYYADVSGGIETFMNQIRNAEDFDALMAEDSGAFLMDNLYADFMNSYHLNGKFNDDPKVNYDGVKNTLEDTFENNGQKTLVMKEFTDLSDDETVAAQGYVIDYNGQKGVVPTDDQEGVTYLTKALLLQMCGNDAATAEGQYNQLKAGVENNFKLDGAVMAAMKNWSDLSNNEKFTVTTYVICTGDKNSPYWVTPDANKANTVYLTKDRVPSKKNIQELLYSAGRITDIHLGELMDNLKDMKNIEDDIQAYILQKKTPSDATMELLHIVDRFILYMGIGQHPSKKGVKAMAGDVKVAYDKAANGGNTAYQDMKEQLLGLIGLLKQTGAGEDIDKMITTLEKLSALMEIIDEENLTTDDLKDFLQLKKDLEAAMNNALDYFQLTKDDLMAALKDEQSLEMISDYIEKMQKLNAAIELLESKGVSLDLNEEQLDKVLQLKEDLTGLVNKVVTKLGYETSDLSALLSDDATADTIVDSIHKLMVLNETLDLLESKGVSLDIDEEQLDNILQMKDSVMNLIDNVMDRLGYEADDLQALLNDEATADSIVEAVNKLITINEALNMLEDEGISLDKAQLENLINMKKDIQARLDAALDIMGISMDELLQILDENTTPEKIAEYAQQIQMILEVLDRLPKNEAELKAELLKRAENVRALIEELGGQMAADLYAQIMDIYAQLQDNNGGIDYDELAAQLQPIFDQLKVIAVAVWNLPEFEDTMNAYKETVDMLGEKAGELQDQIITLQYDVTKLRAKSIIATPKLKLTFPKHKAKVTATWANDEDADGYIFTFNGKEVDYGETKTGYSYASKVKIGKKYTYTVTPYVIYVSNDGAAKQIKGKTYTKTIIPKVPVAKVAIKSVKAGKKSFTAKWKKVKNADGYRISYKVGKKTKYKYVSKKKLSVTIKKLKKGKTYTVKVRAYRKINGKKYFGAWSKAKKVKIKK